MPNKKVSIKNEAEEVYELDETFHCPGCGEKTLWWSSGSLYFCLSCDGPFYISYPDIDHAHSHVERIKKLKKAME